MKATGIVRRIDDLGRIVIPKEIRRTLRIRESDPLEIFTDREGEIILKKYSPIGEMSTFARQYAESLAQVSGQMTLIADRDQFIAAAGGCKVLLGKSISSQLEEAIERRENILASKGDKNFIPVSRGGGWRDRVCQRGNQPDHLRGGCDRRGGASEQRCKGQNGRGGTETRPVRCGFSGKTDGTVKERALRSRETA